MSLSQIIVYGLFLVAFAAATVVTWVKGDRTQGVIATLAFAAVVWVIMHLYETLERYTRLIGD